MVHPQPSTPPGPPGSLKHFRDRPSREKLHPLERALLFLVGAHLVLLPWALGGMLRWSQYTSLAFSVLAFVVALWPRLYVDERTGVGRFRLYPAAKLVRFPLLYLGLLYFALIVVQLFNPAWIYMEKNGGWWLEATNYITWLPHGVSDAPFTRMNAARMVIIHGSAWLLVCALWIGITRRRSAQLLLLMIALNGTALAVIVLLQRLTGADRVLWTWPAATHYFAATFLYKNHAGEFLVLILALCLGLGWWHADRAEQRMRKSSPALAFLFLALLVLFGLLLTYARAASALGLAAVLVVAISYTVHALFASRGGPPALVLAVSALLVAGFLLVLATFIDTDKVWQRFERLTKEDQFRSVVFRQLATQATWDMAQDSLAFGHGVGTYRYVFPWYQQHYPEIYTEQVAVKKKKVPRRIYWEHAHNDYVEWLAETGLVGGGLFLAALGGMLVAIRRHRLFSRPGLAVMLGGPFLVALSAAVDFPAHCPAVLLTALAIGVLTLRWSESENQVRKT